MHHFLLYILPFCIAFAITFPVIAQESSLQDSAFIASLQQLPPTARIDTLNQAAWQLRKKNIALGMKYVQRALTEAEYIQYPKGIARSQSFMGVLERNVGNYGRAIEWYFKALKTAESYKLQEDIAYSYNNIAEIYIYFKEYALSLKYYKQADSIFTKIGDKTGMAYVYVRLGEAYEIIGDLDSSMQFFAQSLMLRQELGDTKNIAVTLLAKGRVYQKMKYHDSAYSIAQYLDTSKLNTDDKFVEDILLLRAQAAFAMGDILRAKNDALNVSQTALQHGTKIAERDAYSLLIKIALQEKDTSQAFRYQQRLFSLDQDINNEEQARVIGAQEAQYELQKKEDALLELQESSQQERRIFIGVGVILIIFIGLSVVLLFLLRKIRLQGKSIHEQNALLQSVNSRLQQLASFKEIMIGTIVHDLKNPLNVIINLSAHEQERAMRAIHQAGRQMLTLVMNILDVQKFEDAQIQLQLMTVSPRKLLTDATHQVEVFLKQYNLQTELFIKTQREVLCDYELTQRILVNLLTNAIKFSPQNEKITLIAEQQQQFIVFAIIDRGEGIPADKHQLIFEKFAQVKKHSLSNNRSTGLGLTFCKMAVEAQGGKIWVESEGGKGTIFYFTIPISPESSPAEIVSTTEEEYLLTNPDVGELSLAEKQQIIEISTMLSAFEVYQYSDIMEIIERLTPVGEGVRSWLSLIESSLTTANQEEYNKLVQNKSPL